MYRWKESERRLGQFALLPRTPGASFIVHYWGVQENHRSNAPHKHSFFEACYVLEGEGTYSEGEARYAIRTGTMFISRPGIVHQIVNEPGTQLLYVAYDLDEALSGEGARAAMQALAESGAVCVPAADRTPAAQLWRSLMLPDDGPALSESALPELAGALLFAFAGQFGEGAPVAETGTAARRPSAYAQLLKQAKLYVADNVDDDELSLAKVAAYLNVSPRHLSRLFASGIRESFTGYVRGQRIRQAVELLTRTDMSIKAIAEATGFGSVHYFTRTFRELMNDSPAHYRDRCRNVSLHSIK
ncbi:AraC family transcriptional regulator [Paenibacillus sp. HJGM_3]|uniref:AraC family transcriptional regulator n=1 Tax=Paenibacillus sp. HJGM_3 TaxID=3379816 RepID=UPI003859F34B